MRQNCGIHLAEAAHLQLRPRLKEESILPIAGLRAKGGNSDWQLRVKRFAGELSTRATEAKLNLHCIATRVGAQLESQVGVLDDWLVKNGLMGTQKSVVVGQVCHTALCANWNLSQMAEVVFVLGSEEVRSSKVTLVAESSYFAELLQSADSYSEVRISLPDWVSRPPLELYLAYLASHALPKTDLLTAQKVLWLADFFLCPALFKDTLDSVILPALTRDNVVYFLNDAYTKLQTLEDSAHWQALFKVCVAVTAKNAQYVFDKFKALVRSFPPALVEQLCLVFLADNARKAVSDYTPVLEVLREVRGLPGFVSFLLREQEHVVADPRWAEKTQEVFKWTAQPGPNPVESPVFEFVGCHWTLSVSENGDSVDVALRNVTPDQPLSWPKHSILCLSVAVDSDTHPPNPVIIAAIAGTKTHNIIDSFPHSRVSLRLRARLEPLYSALLTHLARFPTSTLSTESLRGFPTDKLLVMLKYKYLSVRQEDEALDIVARWSSAHFPSSAAADLELPPVLASIKWQYVSLRGLLAALTHSLLRRTQHFQTIFRREILGRALGKTTLEEQERPRFAYKHEVVRETLPSQQSFLDIVADTLFSLPSAPALSQVPST